MNRVPDFTRLIADMILCKGAIIKDQTCYMIF